MGNQLKGMTAASLRLVLMATMLLLILLAAAVFVGFRQYLIDYSVQVSKDSEIANASTEEIKRLQKLQVQLQDDEIAVSRAEKIVADSKQYGYQNQIIEDITKYANEAGVSITGYTFSSDSSTATDGSAPTMSTPGLNSTEATISIKSPVPYKSIMNFIYAVESNLTKMQVTGVSLSKSTTSNQVVVNPISIKVYTK